MRFLAILGRRTDTFTEQQFEALLEPEAERVRELYSQGILRSVAGRGDMKGAVAELECTDADEARRAINSLPLAAAGMLDVQMIPLLPYRGFAPKRV
jgi:muconolactone delta-isomerase